MIPSGIEKSVNFLWKDQARLRREAGSQNTAIVSPVSLLTLHFPLIGVLIDGSQILKFNQMDKFINLKQKARKHTDNMRNNPDGEQNPQALFHRPQQQRPNAAHRRLPKMVSEPHDWPKLQYFSSAQPPTPTIW
ncbi:hypothetical protein AAHE18_05G098500 [Arachis hypogaea]